MDHVRLDARLGVRNDAGGYRRIEVMAEGRQRRHWSDEEKDRILVESSAPGANVSAVARRNGVNRGLLTVWRRQAGLSKSRKRSGMSQAASANLPFFVPIAVEEDAGLADACRSDVAMGSGPQIALTFEGGRIVIDEGVDPHLAAAVVTAACRRS